jgi:hypothetical protein
MGIAPEFLIKHVRPRDQEAFELMCLQSGPGSLRQWLLDNGVSGTDIDAAFVSWAVLADLPIDDQTLPVFITAANAISQARWTEYYPTGKSTILFMTGPLLKELSLKSSENKGSREYVFDPAENIPLAITISKPGSGQPPAVAANVGAIEVGINDNGVCVHFGGLR